MVASPIVKWAGGKARLLSQYQPYLPTKFKRYFEPFAGGAAMFFWLQGNHGSFRATLNDSNQDLIECYGIVQTRPQELLERLRTMSELHDKEYYYQVRAAEPVDPVERAARLLYLNKTCYNGLYRVNSAGRFNVPMGRYKNPAIVQEDKILAAHAALSQVNLLCGSFEAAVAGARSGDFVYFDPPYQPLNPTSNFTSYTKDSFAEQQQCLLAHCFKQLVKKGCQVLLSNSDCELVQDLYRDYQRVEVMAPRFINSKSDKRRAITELLILGRPAGPR